MSHPVFKPGNTALITGAASGIGLAVAKLCRSHGMKLALVDNNTAHLSQAQKELSSRSIPDSSTASSADTEAYPLDVSQLSQWQDLKGKVEAKFGGVDFLMLNAGIGLKSGWEDVEYFQKIMSTNLFGVINGLSTFLPTLQSRSPNPTSIVITGSKQGITNPPGNPAYNASKAALKSLAEHLSYDLRSTATSVHLLVPGWTYTGITGGRAGGEKPAGAWAPEQVARFLEGKMGEGVFYVLCPDNDVSVSQDRRRMLWGVGDIVEERPPLSRWREEWKGRAEEWMEKQDV
ncbi:hypothetical protein MMC20_003133 [Loxospora ochrophaea]|nr:hypothetical protein [Loxospora ochrophaea]